MKSKNIPPLVLYDEINGKEILKLFIERSEYPVSLELRTGGVDLNKEDIEKLIVYLTERFIECS